MKGPCQLKARRLLGQAMGAEAAIAPSRSAQVWIRSDAERQAPLQRENRRAQRLVLSVGSPWK